MRPRSIAVALAVTATAALALAGPAAARSPARHHAPFVDEIDNPYFPAVPGSTWVYRGSREAQPTRDVVTATTRTIVIQGVTCTVVHDDLFVAGRLFETTDDYYAQDRSGTVHYFGEDTKELDAQGHVVSTEGTWRAGVQGARSGVIMPGSPRVGQSYLEEFFKGHAEDHAKIVSLTASVSVPFGSFQNVLQTKNWTPLDPGVVEHKFYARGVGLIREQDVKGGADTSELVSFTPGPDDD